MAENGCDRSLGMMLSQSRWSSFRANGKHLCVGRVIEGVVGRVKKRQMQEVGKSTLYCAGFLSGGITEIFFRQKGHGMEKEMSSTR